MKDIKLYARDFLGCSFDVRIVVASDKKSVTERYTNFKQKKFVTITRNRNGQILSHEVGEVEMPKSNEMSAEVKNLCTQAGNIDPEAYYHLCEFAETDEAFVKGLQNIINGE